FDFPFELLYHSAFLVPRKIHLVRQVSAYAHKKEPEPQNRALKILFVACSPQGVSVLDFEEEEEAIFDITRNLPVDMDVEDTGSLKGLETQLEYNEYDIIHLTGHADIDEEGPYFCMETEEGFKDKVRPAQLWKILKKGASSPRLLFLSGCRTGQTPRAAFSFAHSLVAEHGPPVVGWGLPVSDPAAIEAAKKLYHELGRGKSITDAVFSARQELFENKQPDWSLLRLFCDGTPLNIPVVKKGQKKKVKPRDIQYVYLEKSRVIVLKRGFVGRRRQIQAGIKCLKSDEDKIGLLLYGTGGLGKSCLAGKFCERFKDHTLVIVHGELTTMTLLDALEDAFIRAEDEKGQEILKESKEIPFKIRRLCSSVFKERNYLILLDDFEKNLKGVEEGNIIVSDEAAPILAVLLQYLWYAGKMTQIIMTSRYQFPFTVDGEDLLHQLALIGLTSFRGADERKKVADLTCIDEYPKKKVRMKLIEAGRGNPRLMEALNSLVETEQTLDAESLLNEVRGKQDEFVQKLLLRKILKRQSEDFQRIIQYSAVYRLPVTKDGIENVCKKVEHWNEFLGLAVRLSLVEEGSRGDKSYYQVTPLLREEVFVILEESEEKMCHQAAVEYYQKVILTDKGYESDYGFELIDHALKCGDNEAAVDEGGRLLPYLRNILAYEAALYEGWYIYSQIAGIKKDKRYSRFLFELGWILEDVGKLREAVGCYKQALSIDKEVYGERHPAVATDLNNLGGAWDALGDAKKAITYYEQALSIDKEVYGERHPSVATRLNNLGMAWDALGDAKKATEYIQQAHDIFQEFYGDHHPHTKITKEWLDNLK
ncbi:MAG: tetratricopeptide repeat protein, partial [Theionarchaea archaeon]|nr:tetratricopeptide repeat protein [Theionarchaea archaeon]